MGYLTQSIIADDQYMRLRVAACAAEQGCAEAGIDPDAWTLEWRRVWGSAPGWDGAWESAVAGGAVAEPGKDPSVITDGQTRSQVDIMKPFARIGQPHPAVPLEGGTDG